MNAARSLVGFAELKQENKFKICANDWDETDGSTKLTAYLTKVCEAVKTGRLPSLVLVSLRSANCEPNTAPAELEVKIEGTSAYVVQEKEKADCQAAVDYWKAAFSNFKGAFPPAYQANTKPYDDRQNVSFISLFNPQATHVDCAYFTCPAAQQRNPKQRNTGTEEEKKALICVTTPNVLTEAKQPYE
ncbi:SAG family member [Eimeria brunetti]|uniref:SAG family member n=1 Tax=Eimeria brunetti TaxID=51314 RepID=U6LQ46_9EIME|nr:SAG family member [Eimeria brunetti]